MSKKTEDFLAKVAARNPGEPEFLQAVKEVVESVTPFIEKNPKYLYSQYNIGLSYGYLNDV